VQRELNARAPRCEPFSEKARVSNGVQSFKSINGVQSSKSIVKCRSIHTRDAYRICIHTRDAYRITCIAYVFLCMPHMYCSSKCITRVSLSKSETKGCNIRKMPSVLGPCVPRDGYLNETHANCALNRSHSAELAWVSFK